MKRIYLTVALIIILLILPVTKTYAEEIYMSKIGSIKIDCKHENISLKNMNTKIYKIANINQNNEYTYLSNFQVKERELNNIATSDLVKYSEELVEFINTNNIEPNNSSTTNQEGIATFNNLSVGLYLLEYESLSDNQYTYNISPVLISVPTIENNIIKYDLEINPKVETTTINSNEESEVTYGPKIETTKKSPKTNDNIMTYIILLIISLLGISIVVLYKKNRKKEKNEKNN